MSAKAKVTAALPLPPRTGLPLTTAERLLDIEQLRLRVNEYVQRLGQIDSLQGTSAEAKEKAVAAFYERMAVLERQLGRIYEELQLG
jgi:hypothetical protein